MDQSELYFYLAGKADLELADAIGLALVPAMAMVTLGKALPL